MLRSERAHVRVASRWQTKGPSTHLVLSSDPVANNEFHITLYSKQVGCLPVHSACCVVQAQELVASSRVGVFLRQCLADSHDRDKRRSLRPQVEEGNSANDGWHCWVRNGLGSVLGLASQKEILRRTAMIDG